MNSVLQGKTAVITGAGSGIGLATTQALMAEGATVVMVDRDKQTLSTLVDELGPKAIAHVADLLSDEDCAQLIPQILEKVPHIDILHCNAGAYVGGDLADNTPADIDRVMQLNVNTVMKNVQSIIPHMSKRGEGDIVVTCSLAGHFPTPWEPVYASSKWAITSFVQIMRRQLNKKGIRVAQISPGPVVTGLLKDWSEEKLTQAKAEGSLIEPQEIADAIVFMLTRQRNVTIRDMIIMPTQFDL